MSEAVQLSDSEEALRAGLQAALEGGYAEFRQGAREFIERLELVQPDISRDEYREKVMEWIGEEIRAGYSRLPYPSEYGGGGDIASYLNFVETIAHMDMSFTIKQGVQFGLFGMGVASLGTEKHHDQHLSDIMAGRMLGGFGMTELFCGSDVQGVRTEAVYDHETRSFTINTPDDDARKAYIGNAAKHGEMMIVFAQLKMPDGENQGVHAFMVPIRENGKDLPGVTTGDHGHKIGLNGIDNGTLEFKNVKIPYDAMLDRFAQIDEDGQYQSDIEKKTARFFTMISTLVVGRIVVAAASASGAKSALTSAIRFAEVRKVFGDTLLDKQHTQTRTFSHLAKAYALHFATRDLMARATGGTRQLETDAAAIKAYASDEAISTIDEMRLVEGAFGYMAEARLGDLRDDVDIFRTFEGDNTVLRLLVAKNGLQGLKQAFRNSAVGTWFSSVSETVASRVHRAMLWAGPVWFIEPESQQAMFARREHAMLYALGNKLRALAERYGDLDRASNECQDDMIAYADAYAERIMLEQFVRAVDQETDPKVKYRLKDLCDLFAVNTMRRHALWYVRNGHMTRYQTEILDKLEYELHEKIRPHAAALVGAFAIPESVLSVPEPEAEAEPSLAAELSPSA